MPRVKTAGSNAMQPEIDDIRERLKKAGAKLEHERQRSH